jgi:hypothetical protein
MRTRKWVGAAVFLAGALMLQGAGTAGADVTSDKAAAVVIWPKILVNPDTDTIVQVSNTSNQVQVLHCFYINATSHCSANGRACDPFEAPCAASEGLCLPGWIETDFQVVLTPNQPLAWVASRGLAGNQVPLDGVAFRGPRGESNAGTRVPPTSEQIWVGELKCVVVDFQGRAINNNAIKGEGTLVTQGATPSDFTVEKYNAVGILAIEGDANGDNILVLGGDANEYNGCSNILIADHFFDFAINPVSGDEVTSQLTLIPCTQDLLNQIPGGTTVQYLVFNEYEQRFSTSTPIQCYFERALSFIDTRNPERSVFSAYVAGTLTGQTRIRGVGQGLVGILRVASGDNRAAHNLHMQGERDFPDQIIIP